MIDDKKNLPSVPTEQDKPIDAATDAYLRVQAVIEAINANLPDDEHLAPIPKDYIFKRRDNEVVSVAMHAAFELNGGVPWLIQWAKNHPSDFIPQWLKLMNSTAATPAGVAINIVSQVPQTPQDFVTIDQDGRVVMPSNDSDDLPE